MNLKKLKNTEVRYIRKIKLFEKMRKKIEELRVKYGEELNGCLLYHFLIGSTPEKDKKTKKYKLDYFDLEGEDSILKLMEDVINPQTQEKQTQTEQKQNEPSTNS